MSGYSRNPEGFVGNAMVSVRKREGEKKRGAPVHEQVVTDERGKRRFHGAFTGGFSAGYFNTVGTEEG